MDFTKLKAKRSHGTGEFSKSDFKELGDGVIFEKNIEVFDPENISIGNDVYIGHNACLKGYYKNSMRIGDHTWIGQYAFFHSAGGIEIGKAVGIGPFVKILTSAHEDKGNLDVPIISNELEFKK